MKADKFWAEQETLRVKLSVWCMERYYDHDWPRIMLRIGKLIKPYLICDSCDGRGGAGMWPCADCGTSGIKDHEI